MSSTPKQNHTIDSASARRTRLRPVIHGGDCGPCSLELQNNPAPPNDYRLKAGRVCWRLNKILLGMPRVQAHLAERGTPPFGVFVHESARVFAPVGVEISTGCMEMWDR